MNHDPTIVYTPSFVHEDQTRRLLLAHHIDQMEQLARRRDNRAALAMLAKAVSHATT